MHVKVKLVNKHKSATADLWHYSGLQYVSFSALLEKEKDFLNWVSVTTFNAMNHVFFIPESV